MQVQMLLPVIPHAVEGNIIHQRASDGYISATAMCNAAEKKIGHYLESKATKEFLTELVKSTKIQQDQLVQIIKGGNSAGQGTWVHPQVAINLATWLSPTFAVQVSKWVFEWMSGGGSSMPVHLKRYMVNRSAIPVTHFSMLNEIIFALIAPLESDGYTLPENMIPDISEGRMFSAWLRKNGIDPDKFPDYSHKYLDGRIVRARLYPNELLADFRKHFNEIWLPSKAIDYFSSRDPKAIVFLKKMLLSLPDPALPQIA